jgi:drug/metabolite transporter (DMT)-like permease
VCPVLAVVLGLCSSLSWGVADFLGGWASRRAAAIAVVLLSQGAGLALMLLIAAAIRSGPPPASDMLFGAAAGAVGAVGLLAFYRGLAVGTMSLVAPIAALGVVVPVAVGVAGGDRPSAVVVVGVVVGVGGATLASRAPGPASTRGLGLALIAAAGFGGFFALLAPAADHDVLWAVIAARFASVPLVLVAALATRTRIGVDGADLPRVLVAGILDSSANLLFAAATQHGLISVVSVLGSLYPVATVALARAVLGERMGPIQGVGVGAALVGVGLIALGAA